MFVDTFTSDTSDTSDDPAGCKAKVLELATSSFLISYFQGENRAELQAERMGRDVHSRLHREHPWCTDDEPSQYSDRDHTRCGDFFGQTSEESHANTHRPTGCAEGGVARHSRHSRHSMGS